VVIRFRCSEKEALSNSTGEGEERRERERILNSFVSFVLRFRCKGCDIFVAYRSFASDTGHNEYTYFVRKAFKEPVIVGQVCAECAVVCVCICMCVYVCVCACATAKLLCVGAQDQTEMQDATRRYNPLLPQP